MSWKKLTVTTAALAVIALGVTLNITSQYTAASAATAEEHLCEYHGIAKDVCTRCNPELIPAFKAKNDWCNEHNLPESQCDICNPDLKTGKVTQAEAMPSKSQQDASKDLSPPKPATVDWCAEHRVPESQCTKCSPELIEGFKAKHDWCGGHSIPESHCYLCNPGLKFEQEAEYKKQQSGQKQSHVPNTSIQRANTAQCATDNAVIQFASVQTAARSGLSIVTVDESPSVETLDVPGEVEFDATQSMTVTCPVGGVLTRWVVNPGEHVQRGQILAYIESIEAAEKKADYVHASAIYNLARKTFDRKQVLAQSGLASAREVDEAETEFWEAQADINRSSSILKMLGYDEEGLAALVNDTDNSSLVPLRARQNGRMVEQSVTLGAILEAGQPVGMISETAQMWVEAQVPESNLDRVKLGQSTTISYNGNGWISGSGHIIWVADGVDENTRMGKVRVAIEPSGANLRAHQFVRVQIATSDAANSVLVPIESVQWEGCCNVVFVQETPDRFKPRKIRVVHTVGNYYAVSGVNSGEKIVSRGSYMLKTELMKSSIGAGCCGEGA